MKRVSALQTISSGTWAATNGGGFFFNSSNNSFTTLHKTDGFNGIKLTAVTIDNSGKIWFGSENGIIDIYDPENNTTSSILDIFNSDRSSKAINQLSVTGDTIIVASDFGISLIDSKNLLFLDTFFKFGSFTSNIVVNSIFNNGLIYASTMSGIAVQKSGAVNLSAPESWNVFTTTNGLPSNNVNKLVMFNSKLIAGTDNGLAQNNGSSWSVILSQFSGKKINDLLVVQDTLYILSENSISAYDGTNVFTRFASSINLNVIAFSPTLGLLAASDIGIIQVYSSSAENIYPNGPAANQFPSMTVDNEGVLWSASGRDVTGVGFYKFDGNKWTTFDKSNSSELPTNSYHVVYAAPDNTKYFGNWGQGFVKVTDNSITNFDVNNTDLVGIEIDPNFLVISGFGADSKNNIWVLNFWAADRNVLNALTPTGLWHHFKVPSEINLTLQFHFNLVVDQFDTKWYSSTDSKRSGLFFFNENTTLTNTADDISGFFSTSNGLNSNSISAIALDKRGELWVGSNFGVNIISNLGSLSSSGSSLRISSVFSLRQQSINCIAVDPLNQKWIGTNQGLLLVNSDGSKLLTTLNTANSALLSDIITSIAINEKTGEIFVGTDNGLTSFFTTAVKPATTFSELFTYPSPFFIGNGNNELIIDGLIKDSDIKILTISGKLLKEFSSPGGRIASWDGKDQSGNYVSSGVYIIVAFDKDGNNVTTGKVAVIRK
ncbi:MAG: hypothetical protein IH949_03835 [Bacteroidetes bacterium]|nr:hypothetical protein [Bacteroidota bacterium]